MNVHKFYNNSGWKKRKSVLKMQIYLKIRFNSKNTFQNVEKNFEIYS